MQTLYETSRDYINSFLERGYLKKDLHTLDDLLDRFIDINIYINPDGTFRVIGIEKKPPERKKAKSVQLYHFGTVLKASMYSSEIEQRIKDFAKFARYFQIQKKFLDIKKLNNSIDKVRIGEYEI